MAHIEQIQELLNKLPNIGDEVTLYTTSRFAQHTDLTYYSDIDECLENPFTIHKVTFKLEHKDSVSVPISRDIYEDKVTNVKITVTADYDLIYAFCHKKLKDLEACGSKQMFEQVNHIHMISPRKLLKEFATVNYYNNINQLMLRYVKLYNTEREALIETIPLVYNDISFYFSQLKRMSKNLFKNLKWWKYKNNNFNNEYSLNHRWYLANSKKQEDVACFRKVILMANRIDYFYAKDFKLACRKIMKTSTQFTNLSDEELSKIINLLNWDRFKQYLYTFGEFRSGKKYKDRRQFFKNYYKMRLKQVYKSI